MELKEIIEDELLTLRDDRVSQMRNNGLVCKEMDGTKSSVIRLGPEDALRIGLKAINEYLNTH